MGFFLFQIAGFISTYDIMMGQLRLSIGSSDYVATAAYNVTVGTLYNIVNCPGVIFAQGTVYNTTPVLN